MLRNTHVYPQYFFGVPTKVPTVEEVSRFYGRDDARNLLINMAPEVGLEPTTLRLTAECSAIELLRSVLGGAHNSHRTSVVIPNAKPSVKDTHHSRRPDASK